MILFKFTSYNKDKTSVMHQIIIDKKDYLTASLLKCAILKDKSLGNVWVIDLEKNVEIWPEDFLQ